MENWVNKLLGWYDLEKRDLPWRKSSDPYAIWISEIMLQQTRVDTVLDYWQRWMLNLPDIKRLAEADPQNVLKLWEGLGYYTRARNLQKAARQIMDEHAGVFPSDYAHILKLPGIGPYTAGAIASIAFQLPVPAVDGNVLRVFSRLFALPEIDKKSIQKEIRDKAAAFIPTERTGDYTQALMELGALVCLPGKPACDKCPLSAECQACQQSRQLEWPIRKEKSKIKKVRRWLAVIQIEDRILMHQRPENGLLASLWEFPGVDGGLKNDMADRFAVEYGIHINIGKHLIDTKHVFTHLEWDIKVYWAELENPEELDGQNDFIWVSVQELDQLVIPTAFQKIKKIVMESKGKTR